MTSSFTQNLRDVVVVGGGPAGLWLAYRLACEGYDVVVFDDRIEIGKHKICTGVVSPEAFDRFELPRDSILNDIKKLKFLSPKGTELDYVHPSLLAHVVERTGFDRDLATMVSQQGAEIRVAKRVDRVTLAADEVAVEATEVGQLGQRERLKARMVVVATGVSLRLNKQLGLGMPNDFINAAQAHITVKNLDCTLCYLGRTIAPGAFAWLVPLDGVTGRVGLMAEANAADCFKNFLSRIAEYRGTEPETIQVEFKPIAQSFVGKTYGNRVIAVGESAGQVKTTTGGGIYYGLLCAELAAEVIMEGLRLNRYDADFLSQYEEKWKREIYHEVKLGYMFRKAFARLSDSQIERLFSLVSMDGIVPLVQMKAKFDWHAEVISSLCRFSKIRKALGIEGENIFPD